MLFCSKVKRPNTNGNDCMAQKIFVRCLVGSLSKLSREGLSKLCRLTVVFARVGWAFILTVQSPSCCRMNKLIELINPSPSVFLVDRGQKSKAAQI